MRPLTEVLNRKDSLLTEAQLKFLDNVVVKAARPRLQARRVFGDAIVFLNDPSKIHVEWSEATGMSKATISLMGEDDLHTDRTDRKPKVLQTYVIEKGWELPWRYSTITELEAEQVAEAGEQVAIMEDEFSGIGGRGQKGLVNASGIQSFTANSWSAATDAAWEARVNDVIEARGKLQDKGHYGPQYQLLVNPQEYKNQAKVRATVGSSAIKELEAVLGGSYQQLVVPWQHVPAGKAYLRDPAALNARLIMGLDMRNIPLPRTGKNIRGEVLEIAAVQIRRANSIVEMLGVA